MLARTHPRHFREPNDAAARRARKSWLTLAKARLKAAYLAHDLNGGYRRNVWFG
jgi:hypothetical protein